jgi:hypothetical protein
MLIGLHPATSGTGLLLDVSGVVVGVLLGPGRFAASFFLMAFAMAFTRTANLMLRAVRVRPARRPAVTASR